jgi:glutaredoxin
MRGNLRRGLALVRRRTHHGPPLAVRLYERAGCHLCDETHRALRRAGLDLPLAIERIDVDTDEVLLRRYTLRVPVIAAAGDELDAAGVDDAALVRWLRARAGAGE